MVNPRFADHTMGTFNRRDTIWGHAKMLADRRPVLGYGFGKKAFVQAGLSIPRSAPRWCRCTIRTPTAIG
jgi:O-antigen ligase